MILEAHGDICRLGYLRIIPCLLEDEVPKTFDFLASVLHEIVRSVGDRDFLTGRPIGLITSLVNARNYVTLAAELDLIDRKSQRLGVFGKLYLCSRSASRFRRLVEGDRSMRLIDLLMLNDAEKLFFLWNIFTRDYPFIQMIVGWAIKKGKFRRQEAMIYAMEEAYPQALKRVLPKSRMREVQEAEKFRERRLMIRDKVEWIKSSQYAKYRHIAPPRFEWLVDCGVLKRSGRGKYEVNTQMIYDPERILKLASLPPERIEQYLFGEFLKPLEKVYRQADRYEASRAIIETYNIMSRHFGENVDLLRLECMAIISLIELGSIANLSMMHDAFNSLAIQFPDKVYVTPGSRGGSPLAYIDVRSLEL
ncbi:MAG: hypothetical protein QXW02_04150 [Nitrososphaerota archaeon]